jgi:addiction module HigA family antidote
MTRPRTHPGEVLREEYMKPLGLSANALARALGVPPNRISDIVRGRRGMTAETAIRLGQHFGVDPRFWLNLQIEHDLSRAEISLDQQKRHRPSEARVEDRQMAFVQRTRAKAERKK